MKRTLSLILALSMLIGLLPTVALTAGAVEGEALAPIVFDFSTAAFSDYATPNKSLNTSNVNTYTHDPEKSAVWKYTTHINEGTVGFQPDGLCFYTRQKAAEKDSNAVVLTLTVPTAGTYAPAIEHTAISYGEKVDLYMVKKSFVEENNVDITDIAGIQSGIALSSMTDADADVVYLASYDTHPNATVADALAKKVNLEAADYYLVAIANEGSINYAAEDRTYGMLNKLTFNPYVDESEKVWTYDFSWKVLSDYTGTGTVSSANINNYTIDPAKSAYWKFESYINENYAGFQNDGLCFYTKQKEAELNSNAVVFTLRAEVDGAFVPSVERTAITYGEKVDLYLAEKTFVSSKAWDVTKIEDIRAAIALSSMTDPDADVLHIAAYDTHPNATTPDAYPEKINLTAGDYYLFVVANEGDVQANDTRTYGMLTKLTLTPWKEPERVDNFSFNFTLSAYAPGSSSAVNVSKFTSTATVNPDVSDPWYYVNLHNIPGNGVYADGFQYYARKDIVDNNFVVLAATFSDKGTFIPSLNFTKAGYTGKVNIHMIPKNVADGAYKMTSDSLVIADVLANAKTQKVISVDTHTNSAAASPSMGDPVVVEKGEYYLIFTNEMGAKDTSDGRYYGYLRSLDFERTFALTSIEAELGDVRLGEELCPELKFFSGEEEIDGSAATVSIDVLENDSEALIKTQSGKVFAVGLGDAKIKVSATLAGVTKSEEIELTVLEPLPLSGYDMEYFFTNTAYQDFNTGGLVVSGAKQGHLVTEAEYNNYAMRDYGSDRPWGLVSAHMTRPDSKGAYLGSSASYTDMSGEIGDWVAYKVKVPAPGKYNVDVSGYKYKNGGRAEIYMVPYTSGMNFSSVAAAAEAYMVKENLVADADLNEALDAVGRVAFAGEFVASSELDYETNGYAEYLMIIKTCGSYKNPNARYVLLKGVHLSGNFRETDVTTYLSEDEIGVGESVTVSSVEGTYSDGTKASLSDAELIFSVHEGDEEIISYDEETGYITALSEGVATLDTCVISNGTISYAETEITVNENFGIMNTYLYTDTTPALGDTLSFTSGFELNNRKVINGGTIISVDITSDSPAGVLAKNGDKISVVGPGVAYVQAKINARGNIVDSDIVKITVTTEEKEASANVVIDLRAGAYTGDTQTLLDDIKVYSDYRPWIFLGANNLLSSYPTIPLATEKFQYAQIVFTGGENLYNSYFAFKVKFSKGGIYRADMMMGLLRYRSALLDMYVMPATSENEADILGKTVRSSDYFVGSADFYASSDASKVEKTFGTFNVEPGEYIVVYRIGEGGAAGTSGDCAYPLYMTFINQDAFNSAEMKLSGDKTVLGLGESSETELSLFALNGNPIEVVPEKLKSVEYKSQNTAVATVDKNGVVTGKSEGEAIITAEITYDGMVNTARMTVSVSDDSGIVENGISVSSPTSVYVYGGLKLKLSATMNSGNTIEIPEEYVTWEILEGADGIAELSGNYIYGTAVGSITLGATVSSEYKNGAADGIEIAPIPFEVTWDMTIDPQIYTLEERENAKNNTSKYAWAREEVNKVKAAADPFVDNFEKIYNLIVPEGLPRWYHIGHTGDPEKFKCRYCGEDVGKEYGSYGWGVNALNDPWKVQCPICKRKFPSNDFGSFYKLGLSESGRKWDYLTALQKHHEMFVCEDVKAGGECTHTSPFEKHFAEYYANNGKYPEIASEAWYANDPRNDEWYAYYGYGVPGGYLTNNLYSDMDAGWAVDDSLGYRQRYESDPEKIGYSPLYYDNGEGFAHYADGARRGPVQHTFISYYLHEGLWYGQGNTTSGHVVRRAINNLAKAFVYTGEAKYGRAGAILLDKIADFYPDFDWFKWNEWRGDDYYGTIVDPVWSTFIATEYADAYDAFLPIYNDPYVINFLAKNGARYEEDAKGNYVRDNEGNLIPTNLKDTPGGAKKNIEDNLLLEIFEATKYGKNWGNFGMHQGSVATAAVALNRLPESKEMIDWIMAPGPKSGTSGISTGTAPRTQPVSGGMFIGALMEDVDRDGSGTEAAPGYNSLWPQNFLTVAELLKDFELYPSANLYENPKFTKMFSAQARLTLGGYYTTQTGDSGAIASTGYAIYTDDIMKGYKATRDPFLAQVLWLMKENYGDEIRGSILDDDPEALEKEIEALIDEIGEMDLGSDMLSGYGFAALRAGAENESASESSYSNTNRDVALYFGKNDMHGHLDTLNLFMDAFGLNIAPDLGYPEVTGTQPHRYEWVRTTISHNTVLIDEKEQGTRTYAQKPLHFDDSGRVKLMDVSADVYADADDYRRTVMMVEVDDENAYNVDFFHVKGGRDHMYSFHSQSDELSAVSGLSDLEVTPMYTDELGNTYGTYAGADVMWGADPGGVFSATYPRGYTWLRDVRTYSGVEKNFSVEFNVKDWKKVLKERRDVRLRVTMVNDDPMEEVTFASARPQQTSSNKHAGDLEYLIVRNKGNNLDTTFTTVFEPYDKLKNEEGFIESIEKASMVRDVNSKPGVNDAYSAVKVTLRSGRVDYVIYSTNNEVDYVIDDMINFRGFAGVMSLDGNGNVVYTYINDGEVLKLVSDESEETALSAYTGKVSSFNRDLSFENKIVYTPTKGETVDVEALAGKFVYIENDGAENGVYKIQSAREVDGKIELNIGDVSLIRKFVDVNNEDKGYVYNIAEGNALRIPLSAVETSAPIIEPISDVTATAGSQIIIPINAYSPIENTGVTLIGTSIPRGMAIDEENGKLIWTPAASQEGENHVAITVSDGTLETTVHFTVTVYGKTTGGTPTTPTTPTTPSTPTTPTTPDSGTTGGSGSNSGG
ncbi:MAG: heparinase II/III family protein, partial [Oscillospiraceae bacterium]|nr:heparinase II/III family protein [Oscillospiraceae bacterium]